MAALYRAGGPEIGVAATKTLLTQIVSLEILALYLAEMRGTLATEAGTRMARTSSEHCPIHRRPRSSREAKTSRCSQEFTSTRDFFYLGRHVGYPVAMEGALNSKSSPTFVPRRTRRGAKSTGPSLSSSQALSWSRSSSTRTTLREKMLANVSEVKSRGATVVLVANDGDEDTSRRRGRSPLVAAYQ